jgi:superfamily II DNA or RNA helicase
VKVPIELRSYQIRDIEALRVAFAQGRRAVCYVSPTGSGKTITFSYVIDGAVRKGHRVGVVVHRRELVRQTSSKLAMAGVPHGIIAAGLDRDHDAPVLVLSVATACRRLEQLPDFDFVIPDECHHATAETWRCLLGRFQRAKLLGTTATPSRLDGCGLGVHCGGLFDELVIGATVRELQDGGYLARSRVFIPSQQINLEGLHLRGGDFVAGELAERAGVVTGDAVREYTIRAAHRPALAYACTVDHAESIAAVFRAAGYRAACVHGRLPPAERDALIDGLATGAIEVLASCDLISEGLDVPSVGAVILLRPTKSLVLHCQQIGRGLRPAPGKEYLCVLDHARNSITHGLAEMERLWTLDGVPKRNGHAPGWRCVACGRLNSLDTYCCDECRAARPIGVGGGRRVPELVAGHLYEMEPGDAARIIDASGITRMSYRRFLSRPRTEAELTAYAEARGYKRGWVWHRLSEQQAGGRRP